MPIVPFNPQGPKASASQPVDDPWLLMAAAQMDAEGRLIESESKTTKDSKDG